MEVPLNDFISKIASDKRVITYDESKTKQAIILEILYLLGWNTADPDEVTPEYWIKNDKVDYALGNGTKKFVFIEVKKPQEDLSRHQDQVVKYAFRAGAKLAILTNGMTWQFFLPHDSDEEWDSKRFFETTLTRKNAKSTAQKFTTFLSKRNVLSNKSIESAKKLLKNIKNNQKVKQSLPEVWNTLLMEHNPVITKLIIKRTQKKSDVIPSIKQIEDFIDQYVLGGNVVQYMDIKEIQSKTKTKSVSSSGARISSSKKPVSKLKFNGKTYRVHTNREALLKILEIMKKTHPKEFTKILKLHGIKRPYFSTKKEDLADPRPILGTNIYYMGNVSAVGIGGLIRRVLDTFDEGTFELL